MYVIFFLFPYFFFLFGTQSVSVSLDTRARHCGRTLFEIEHDVQFETRREKKKIILITTNKTYCRVRYIWYYFFGTRVRSNVRIGVGGTQFAYG